MWEPKPLGPNALADEAEDRAFHERCARELRAMEAPTGISRAELHRELLKLCFNIGRMVRDELNRRMAEIEQKQLHMAGTYKCGQRYRENSLVSFQGGLWLALCDTDTRPGSGSPAWRLAVKRGDAK